MDAFLDYIQIKSARVHNLKNLSLKIPKNKVVVITGPSGSGKSSLAFDLLYAESQRRFIESLSTKARQFIELMNRPDVDAIIGLSPAIALSQKQARYQGSSNVGSITEIQDFLQILYQRLAVVKCEKCGEFLEKRSAQETIEQLCDLPEGSKLQLLFPWRELEQSLECRGGAPSPPVCVPEENFNNSCENLLSELKKQGFVRARINGQILSLDDDLELEKLESVDIVYDRLIIKAGIRERLADSVEECLRLSGGRLEVIVEESGKEQVSKFFSTKFFCRSCDLKYPEVLSRELVFGSDVSMIYYFSKKSFAEVLEFTLSELSQFIGSLSLNTYQKEISEPLFREINKRIEFLSKLKLDYLKLSQPARELSLGESQRIRLASCLSSDLSGVLYVLDEPSLGLDAENVLQLVDILKELRDQGNSVLVVEHDLDIIKSADYLIEMGPGAGELGGEIVVEGDLEKIRITKDSKTAKLLNADFKFYKEKKRDISGKFLEINFAGRDRALPLHGDGKLVVNVDKFQVPLSCFTAVTGKSASGKSLLLESIYQQLSSDIDNISNSEVEKVIFFDDSPIGANPRSNPATYLEILTEIRSLYASTQEARLRGYKAGRFSFNNKGGRCETCEGAGQVQIEMKFLADVFVNCSVCQGKRFNRETLEIAFKGYNVAEVLEMSVEEALVVFQNIPKISHKLRKLREVGLGYLRLGQGAHTLSGGEAQRVKLAKELARKQVGKTLYLFDEPTQGLFADDINRLLEILHALVDLGNTVVVAEHDKAVIESADYVCVL